MFASSSKPSSLEGHFVLLREVSAAPRDPTDHLSLILALLPAKFPGRS